MQSQLISKIVKMIPILTTLTDTELIRIGKELNFYEELEQLGYNKLINKSLQQYNNEIASIFAELNSRELSQVAVSNIQTLQELAKFEMEYLKGNVKQYSEQLKNAMMRRVVTGETNAQIIAGLETGFGVGKFISSSETEFLINDAFARFSSTARAKAFQQFPQIKFQYVGPSTGARPACVKALAEPPLTQAEINDLGYVDFGNRGGYNCRHDWIRV